MRAVAAQYIPWGHALSTDNLRDDLLLDLGPNMNGGVGVMLEDGQHEGGTLQVLHSFHKHPGRGEHRGKIFVSVGDVRGIDIEVLALNLDILEPATAIHVAEDAAHQSELFAAGGAGMKLTDGFDVAGARTREVRVRRSVYIPYTVMPFVLDKNLTARQAFETIVPILQDQNLEAACSELIDFLIVASTKRRDGVASPHTVTAQTSMGTIPLRSIEVIQERRKHLLFVHLPAVQPQTTRSDPALLGIMNTIQEVHAVAREDYNDRKLERDRAKSPKTIEERWPTYVDRLCKLCGVDRWENLPTYWHEAAAYKKSSGTTLRSVLQDSVDLAAHQLSVAAPLVTVQHANAVQNWLFIGSTEFSLGGGILPFTVTPPGAVSKSARDRQATEREQNADHNIVMEGNSSLSAADARAMRSNNTYIPMDMEEADLMLESYTAFLAALLGTVHPNVLAHQRSLREYKSVRPHLKMILGQHLGPRLAPATLVYYYQAKHRRWFQRQWDIAVVGTLPPPAFSSAFETFAEGYNLSWLPTTSHIDVLSKLAKPVEPGSPAGRPVPRVIPVTPDPGSPQRVRERNMNKDTRFFNNTPLALKVKAAKMKTLLMTAAEPPPITGGNDRCLTWHLKGSCFKDCPRVSDHVALAGEDKEKLFEWVSTNLAQ